MDKRKKNQKEGKIRVKGRLEIYLKGRTQPIIVLVPAEVEHMAYEDEKRTVTL